MSHRHEQLESTLKRAVQQVLAHGLQDPRANGAMITVTDLTIAKDLKNATVMVSIYPEQRQKLVMHAVRHAAAHIRHEVSELVAMRAVPHISFELDIRLKRQAEVLAALRRVEEEKPVSPAAPASDPGTPDIAPEASAP
ncbi:MAG: 30S ribosome-binding factor RbfA [Phycisphaerales bacterium]